MITRQAFRPLVATTSRSWVCPACSSSITSRVPTPSKRKLLQRRSLYTMPELRPRLPEMGPTELRDMLAEVDTPAPELEPVTLPEIQSDQYFHMKGIPGLMGAEQFNRAWTDYQSWTLRKLNEKLGGSADMNKDPKDLVLRYARDPAKAAIFNYASMAHNNHFFFSQFERRPVRLDQFKDLRDELAKQFSSEQSLKQEFINTALSMFGGGFVWLVWARTPGSNGAGRFRILSTYNAGTPYPEAGFMQQGIDMNTSDPFEVNRWRTQGVGLYGQDAAKRDAKLPPGGTTVMPVLCVSVWEHTWLGGDYTIYDKENYLNRFWAVINWQAVKARVPADAYRSFRN